MKKVISYVIISLLLLSAIQAKDIIKKQKFLGPGTYEILKTDSQSIRIPFEMVDGKPVMVCEINGKPARMMIDNGVLWDQVWLFGSPLVEELGLKPIEEGEIGGSGEGDPTAAYTSTPLTMKFDDIIFHEQPVLVSPLEAGFARIFPGADGQLCNTFFKHFIVEFDFENNDVILHDPKTFNYSGKGSVLDMLEDEVGAWSVPFSFTMPDGKVYNDRVDIDFGGIYALKIALGTKHEIQLPKDVEPIQSFGAQGRNSENKGRIKNMTFGDYTFDNPIAVFGDGTTSRIHPENLGIIGLPLFMQFDIIFDYLNEKLYIEPNENFRR